MEYLSGGSCGDLLKAGIFKEDYIAVVLRELCRGLEYLHGEGKLHRDIKGQSMLSLRAVCTWWLSCGKGVIAANVLLSANGEGK